MRYFGGIFGRIGLTLETSEIHPCMVETRWSCDWSVQCLPRLLSALCWVSFAYMIPFDHFGVSDNFYTFVSATVLFLMTVSLSDAVKCFVSAVVVFLVRIFMHSD